MDRLDLNYQSIEEHFQDALEDDGIGELLKAYSRFQEDVRNGVYGKTSQFWMLYYLDIMRNQHLIRESVHTNNFFFRLHGLKAMLPFMFVLNKQNYARHGSMYVNTLENLDITHPGCRELLERNGLSVQGQDIYPCRTPIDQRGEQTINRDAKVAGGIKYFASDQNAILKWTLNHAAQAKNTEELYNIAGVRSSEDMFKMIRPSEVLKSERLVTKLQNVITKEYMNPFDASLDPSCL